MPTTASADFSQFVVTTANGTVCETSRGKSPNLSSFTCPIYAPWLRLPLGLCCLAPAYPHGTPYIGRHGNRYRNFLSVRPRFRYPFFSPVPHGSNLGSRYRVRWQLRPLGLSPKVRDMPVTRKKSPTSIGGGMNCDKQGVFLTFVSRSIII